MEVVANPLAPTFEVWFVHGLTGNRRATWTHRDGDHEVFWPRLLASDFPTAKVTMYGYDASVIKFSKTWKNAPDATIQSYGEELASAIRSQRQESPPSSSNLPIYFIGHSLGGLVVEQALLICLDANADDSMVKIAADAAGIFFMGTPHHGSHLAKWGSVLCKLVPDRLRSSNKRILDALSKRSEVCRNLSDKFQAEHHHGRLRHVRVYCFYETVPMPLLSKRVVNEESAVIPGQPRAAITGDHVTMVQFKSDTDPGYKSVKGQLVSWLSPASNAAADSRRSKTKKKKKSATQITLSGPTFNSPISGGTINSRLMASGRDLVTGRHGKIVNNVYATAVAAAFSSSESDSDSGDNGGDSDSDDSDDSEGTVANDESVA